jgi:hypothetical protein
MYGNLAASTALRAHKDEAIDSRVHRASRLSGISTLGIVALRTNRRCADVGNEYHPGEQEDNG